MLGTWIKRAIGLAIVGLIVAATVYALLPTPVGVDVAEIDRGRLAVGIDEEGIAKIRNVFQVSAPVTGRLERPPVEVGDRVERGITAVASIHPVDPPFLDVRSRREIEAAVEAARAGVGLAEAQVRGAESSERMADSDLTRAKRLSEAGTISARAFEEAVTRLDVAKAQVEQAKATLTLRHSELISAEASLIQPDQPVVASERDHCCLTVRAPVDGVVLKVVAKSEQVVPAGAPLLEIGDPTDTEIVVHLLSSDAVAIAPGAAAEITDWGGPEVLSARVRRIDPAAYTKISALGIEEQRVDATLDLVDDYAIWQGLGHEFRVMVHIRTWESGDVVRVPIGALFRQGADWHVFRVVDGTAALTRIDIGHRNNSLAEVTDGLSPGDVVVLHPSDAVSDGVGIAPRENSG